MAFPAASQPALKSRSLAVAIVAGVSVGALGGLIGLGGAEFRLPLLIAVFGFAALQAVIVNKAMSLIVVADRKLWRGGRLTTNEVDVAVVWPHTWTSLTLFSPAQFSSLPGWPMPTW